jgi:ABC-type nitrate/sulfonate/bicarbonate transport system substrate-binding protein
MMLSRATTITTAALNAGPFTVRAEKEGFVRLADIATMGRPYVYGTVAARDSFIQSRPDVIRRFSQAFVEGIHRFKTDRRLALATVEKYTKAKTTPESEQVYESYANRYIKRTSEITREGMQTIHEEIAESRNLLLASHPSAFSTHDISEN